MNRTGALRGLVGLVAAVTISTSGPALATAGGPATQASSHAVSTAAACASGTRACPIRITFDAGAYSGQAHSRLANIHSQRWFIVRARAGQALIVIVEGRDPTRGVVYFPDGRSSGQPGGRVFDGIAPTSGDYRIRVTESSMGEALSGRVDVVAVIY